MDIRITATTNQDTTQTTLTIIMVGIKFADVIFYKSMRWVEKQSYKQKFL